MKSSNPSLWLPTACALACSPQPASTAGAQADAAVAPADGLVNLVDASPPADVATDVPADAPADAPAEVSVAIDAGPNADTSDFVCYDDVPLPEKAWDCVVVNSAFHWCNDTAKHCLGYQMYGVCEDCLAKWTGTCGKGTYCQDGECVPEPPCPPGKIQCLYHNEACEDPGTWRECKPDGSWSIEYFCAAMGCKEIDCQM